MAQVTPDQLPVEPQAKVQENSQHRRIRPFQKPKFAIESAVIIHGRWWHNDLHKWVAVVKPQRCAEVTIEELFE